jgi:RNA polymerase sigma-32 factor
MKKQPAKNRKPAAAKGKSQPGRREPGGKNAPAKPAKAVKVNTSKAAKPSPRAKARPGKTARTPARPAAAKKKLVPAAGLKPKAAPKKALKPAQRAVRPAAAKPRPKTPAATKPAPRKSAARKPAVAKPQPAAVGKPARPKAEPVSLKAAAPKPASRKPAVKPPVPPEPPLAATGAQEAPHPAPAAPVADEAPERPEALAVEEKPAARRAAKKEPKPKAPRAPRASKSKKDDDDEKSLVKFDPLQRYLSEISKYRLLTREEERDYGIRVKEQGDKDAAYALVTANLRLVVKIALEFQRVWMQNLLDLIQEGNIGLMQAVKKFDPYKNVKFSYYASFWIKAYILKFIMDNWRLVKIGTTQGQRKLFFKLKKEKQHLIEQGFDPKPKLLSERLGVSEREIVDMDQRLDGWDVSLDAPLKNDSETERIEFLSTDAESIEDQVSKKEIELLLHNKISEFRKKMSPREVEIFELRIFSDNPVTLQEIGDRYEISRERVRQIEKNIIRKMREFFKREIPDFASYSDDTGMDSGME